MATSQVTIKLWNRDALVARLDKLNRKAIKIGVAPIQIIGEEIEIKTEKRDDGKKVNVPYLTFTLEFETIVVGDYTFVGTIDHTNAAGNLVKNAPNQSIPAEMWECKPTCDHCNTQRDRNETFVFVDGNGEYVRVGRNCLAVYFGIDPIRKLAFGYELAGLGADEDSWGGSERYEADFAVGILSLALAIVDEIGYVSASKAREDQTGSTFSTKDVLMYRVINHGNHKDAVEFAVKIQQKAPEFKDAAKALIEWGKEYFATQDGEYAHNMRVILADEIVRVRNFSFLISLIGAKAREDAKNIEKAASSNEWIGTEKAKIEVPVTVNKIAATEGFYGTTYICRMSDSTGNVVVWFASSHPDFDEGDQITIKGTVKKLDEYKGRKQTVLTRCKVV